MSGRRGTFAAIAAVLALMVCLSGCVAGQDQSLERIKKAKVIRVAMTPGYPPFSYYNSKNEMVGFDAAFAKEIARRMEVDVKIVSVAWKDIMAGLIAGDYDAIVGSMSVTEERAKVVDFSQPYYHARSQAMVLKGSALKNVKELKTKTVGVIEGTTFEDDAKALGAGQLRRYKTNDEALVALHSNEVDAVITDDVVAHYATANMGFAVESLGDTLSTDKISIAVRKGDCSLLKRIDAIIGEMKKDGTLRGMVERMASGKLDRP